MQARGPSGMEAQMAMEECPKCGARFPAGDGWANSALATLISAPAVPDMATQVRCPQCQHVFAEGEVRYQRSAGAKRSTIAFWLLGFCLVIWAIYQVYSG